MPEDVLRPKELALIDLIQSEKAKRRKVWIYVQYTDKHDVQGRLEKLLTQAGIRVKILRSSVPLGSREEWIADLVDALEDRLHRPVLRKDVR